MGEIPEDWDRRRLKSVVSIRKVIIGETGPDVLSVTQRGIRVKDTSTGEGQLSTDYSKYQVVEVGDFVMNHMDLLTGFVDRSENYGVTSPDYRVFRLESEEIEPRFLLRILQIGYWSKIFYGLGQGVSIFGRWRLPTESFRNFRIPVPPLPEQQEIVSFLDEKTSLIDEIIEKKTKRIELLKELKSSLISEVVTKGLDPDVEMKDSGVEWIGEIPSHWDRVNVRYLGSIQSGDGFPVDEQGNPEGTIPFFKVSDTNTEGNSIRLTESQNYVTEDQIRSHRWSLHPTGTLVFPKIGEVLFKNKRRLLSQPSVIDNNMMGVTFGDRVIPEYGIYSFMTVDFREFGNPGTVPSLNSSQVGSIQVLVPPLPEQQDIVSFLDIETYRIDNQIDLEEKSITLLKELRQSLISEVVTGKIDVRKERVDEVH